MKYNTKLFATVLSLSILITQLHAMDGDEALNLLSQNTAISRYSSLSETEKSDIEELKSQYFLSPSPFKLKITTEAAFPPEMYPIGIVFTPNYNTPRTILLTNNLYELPENIRLPGHQDKRLPCNWYYPASTRLAHTNQGWENENWINLFEQEEPIIVMQDLNSSYAVRTYPMVVIYGVDTPTSPQNIISFKANNRTSYDLYFDPILKKDREGNYSIILKVEDFKEEGHS